MDAQEQQNEVLRELDPKKVAQQTKDNLAAVLADKEASTSSTRSTLRTGLVEEAMEKHPGLTAEEAEEMIEFHGG
jgi:hypothetical protein